MTEAENRAYAINLLNRADLVPDPASIRTVARIVEMIEQDVLRGIQTSRAAGAEMAPTAASAIFLAIEAGQHRPAGAATAEGNYYNG